MLEADRRPPRVRIAAAAPVDLERSLARAARQASHPAALDALARLDPATAALWLTRADAPDALPADARRRTLDHLARRALEAGDAELARTTLRAAERNGDALGPDAAAALAEAIPEGGDLAERLLDAHLAHPGLLRVAARRAMARGESADAHALLTRLGRADAAPHTLHWILRQRGALPALGAPARVALLASFTARPLEPFLDLELRAAGMAPEVYVAPYGAWEREAYDPASHLRDNAPDLVVLMAAVEDLVPSIDSAAASLGDELAGAVERIADAAAALRGWCGAPIVVHSLHAVHPDPAGHAATRGAATRAEAIARANERLRGRLFDLPEVYLLDLQALLARRAGGAADEPKLRHLARMRLGGGALPELARAYAGYASAALGRTRKCLLLDLDNTLWGGIVGEDGADGVRLGEQSPGAEFVEFQRYLAALSARGMLLAVVSKNNEADALEVIQRHDAMVLRTDAFAAMRINWLPKPDNAREIARELGIGVDSMVFIDDNPKERALMRAVLPEVLTPELPADPALYRATLESLPELQTLRVTREDAARLAEYRGRRARVEARGQAASLDSFLQTLELRAAVSPPTASTLPRIAQLFERTNQFNLTTRRHGFAQLCAWAADPAWRLFALRAGDRYSDHGLVGAATVRTSAQRWEVESFLLSCRAIGFGLESALLAAIARDAAAAGATELIGEFLPGERNRPAADFWGRHGFERVAVAEGVERWRRELAPGALEVPTWIAMEGCDAS